MEEKIKALAEYIDVDSSEVEYNEDNDSYEVSGKEYKVYDEDEANQAAKEYIENFIDEMGIEGFNQEFQDWIKENALDKDFFEDLFIESYTYYVDDIESEDDEQYENRLIAELIENGIIEDGEQDEEDFDIDDAKAQYVTKLVDGIDDYVQEYIFQFGGIEDLIRQNPNIIDIDAIVEEAIDWDGRGHFLAWYDGKELDLGDGYYAYRID
jgi:hypothetical protein